MVGHIPLEDGIGVRVPDPQQRNLKERSDYKISASRTNVRDSIYE